MMLRSTLFALTLGAAWLGGAPAWAQATPIAAAQQSPLAMRADDVVRLLNGAAAPADIFSASFRAAVADAQITALSESLVAQFGPATGVAVLEPQNATRAAIQIRFERGMATGFIGVDPAEQNRINELVFTKVDTVAPTGDTPTAIKAELEALPGRVNAWFAPLNTGTATISLGANTPLALGSTFKLYVLAALAEDVKAGRRAWSDIVPLTRKSYPSGQLQDWPKGAPVTLHTLASLMISISDNTATDQLIALLGEARLLKLMTDSGHSNPGANDPFLTTRQLFLLKASGDSQIAVWRKGDRTVRNAILASLADDFAAGNVPLETINAAFANGPKAIDIEWFASPADLAKLAAHMQRTADPKAFDIMAINPSASPGIKANWDYIGFKGGSEPGVLNLTWLLRDKAGAWHILTLGWNDPAAVVDDARLLGIAQRILLLPR
ncbi:serine hydrolase [Erythrobacter sp. R86502]|uniref:serine hydrolase n=1 Tax=Erythrobacter sp. R86502 TaxID=3093846 RepID=UPI0036D3C4AA